MDPGTPSPSRTRERILATCLFAGVILAVLGLAVTLAQSPEPSHWGPPATSAGLLIFLTAIHLAHPLDAVRVLGGRPATGPERVARWARFRALGLGTNLLVLLSALFLLVAALDRLELVDGGTDAANVAHAVTFLALAVTLTAAAAFHASLRISRPRTHTHASVTALRLLAVLALLLAALAASVAARPIPLGPDLELDAPDVAFLLLAAVASAASSLAISRRFPGVHSFLEEEREPSRSVYVSRAKSVLLPTFLAFALLFLVLLLALVFQFGITQLVREIPRNLFLLGAVLFTVAALVATLWMGIVVARSEERVEYYRPPRDEERRRAVTILGVSGSIAGLLFLVALVLGTGRSVFRLESHQWIDVACLGILALTGPFGFYYARRMRRIRRLEERFPDLLRDLAASRKAGLTLSNAISIAARGEYGELTPEIRRMADQLALNITFEEALQRFGERVNTPLIQRAVVLIQEAGRTGGQVTDVLEAAAIDAREIKTLENERHTNMLLYSAIIYIIFGVFLLVASVMYGTFVPQIVTATETALGSGAQRLGGVVFTHLTQESYRVFYFAAALVQGIGNGLIAGLIETGRALAGLRHSFFMVALAWVVFVLVL
jgi:archaeal flagellar protein FlaJ